MKSLAVSAFAVLFLAACEGEHKAAENIPRLENYVHKFQTTTVDGAKVTCFTYLERHFACVKE
jgi:hypothetical protein